MKVNEAIRQALKDVTLKDLVSEAKRKMGGESKATSGRRC
jgi:DNA-binding IscR family transcriptional regulator